MEQGRKIIPEEEIKRIKAMQKAEYIQYVQQKLISQIPNWSNEELKEKVSVYFNLDIKMARFLCTEYVLRKYNIMTDILTHEIKAYSEESKYYQNIGTEKIKKFITDNFNLNNSKQSSEEILHLIKTKTYTTNEDIKKARNNDLIPFKNGIFNLKENKLIEHDPKYLFDYQIPIIYDPQKKCLIFEKFINEVIKKENKPFVYDIFALVLYPKNILEKFFVLTGNGSNGKSVFINLLEKFIGHENKSAISLKQMTDDKFSVAKMYKKLLNVGADISSDIITDTSVLKTASASDSISGQFKFGQIFDFIPSATLVFSANTPPLFKDNSDGMNRRPELIPFPFKFGNDKDIEEDPTIKKADPNILEKITSEDEMSGILNIALKHLIDIKKKGQLSIVRSVNSSKLLYKRYSNSVIAYVEEFYEECQYIPGESDRISKERITVPAEGFIFVKDIYPKYKEWCLKNQLQIKPKNSFTKSLSFIDDWNIEIGLKDQDDFGNKIRSIRGIKWKD